MFTSGSHLCICVYKTNKFCKGTRVRKHTGSPLQTKYYHIERCTPSLLLLIVHCFFPGPLTSVGQVAQAARCLAIIWMARVRSQVPEECRFFFTSSCLDRYWGPFPIKRRLSLGLATLPLPSAVTVYMWILASTFPVGIHSL